MSTNDTNDMHPEEKFIALMRGALEYGSRHRDEISQEVFTAACSIPNNMAYYIKQHKQHEDVLGTHNVHSEFRTIPAYFERLDKLFAEGYNLRKNSAIPTTGGTQ